MSEYFTVTCHWTTQKGTSNVFADRVWTDHALADRHWFQIQLSPRFCTAVNYRVPSHRCLDVRTKSRLRLTNR